mmetsp:Transcript_25036/g.63009  ORF Transcript_25036/g.63009 Transcript_25036/m.63009 type:complete len:213 (+) Transcript_25036:585-1223(+)
MEGRSRKTEKEGEFKAEVPVLSIGDSTLSCVSPRSLRRGEGGVKGKEGRREGELGADSPPLSDLRTIARSLSTSALSSSFSRITFSVVSLSASSIWSEKPSSNGLLTMPNDFKHTWPRGAIALKLATKMLLSFTATSKSEVGREKTLPFFFFSFFTVFAFSSSFPSSFAFSPFSFFLSSSPPSSSSIPPLFPPSFFSSPPTLFSPRWCPLSI